VITRSHLQINDAAGEFVNSWGRAEINFTAKSESPMNWAKDSGPMNSSPIHWAFALSQEIHFLAASVGVFQGTALAIYPNLSICERKIARYDGWDLKLVYSCANVLAATPNHLQIDPEDSFSAAVLTRYAGFGQDLSNLLRP
jgi:hypothetical protein